MIIRYDWSIAVFGMNEAATIRRCLVSIARGTADRIAHITVILNGTTDTSAAVVDALAMENVTVVTLAHADKSDAINHFVHEARPRANTYFFVDAYVELCEGALKALAEGLDQAPRALIATGVQSNGRSAKVSASATMAGGKLNGQLYAVQAAFLDRMTAAGIRLPSGLYRGDGLFGSMACHNLDAATPWCNDRIIGVMGAKFSIVALRINFQDIKRQFRREVRQARGMLENAAIKSIIYEHGYIGLPANSDEMINTYLAINKFASRSLRERFFIWLARRKLKQPSR